jgi:hypothetical protein
VALSGTGKDDFVMTMVSEFFLLEPCWQGLGEGLGGGGGGGPAQPGEGLTLGCGSV